MTNPIDPTAREILRGVFEAFEKGRESDSTVGEVVLNKIGQLKDVFDVDLREEFDPLKFLKNTKIADLSTRDTEMIERIFSRVLGTRVKSTPTGSTSPSTTSLDSPETVALVEGHLRGKGLTIERVRESGYSYQAAMRESLEMRSDEKGKKLNLMPLPITPSDAELVLIEKGGIKAPDQFMRDHVGDRKNPYMKFSFPASPDRSIRNQTDLVAFDQSVTAFTDTILGEGATDEKKAKMRSTLLFFSSQHIANCVAQPFAAMETELRAAYENLPSFQIGPTDAKYSFEPMLDADGNVVPNQFRMKVHIHVGAFQSIQLDQATPDEVERFHSAREELGIGEVAAAEVTGEYIVAIDEDNEIFVLDLGMDYFLTLPPIDEVDRAKAIIEEAAEKPIEELQREWKQAEQLLRKELEFFPFEKEKILSQLSIDWEGLMPTEEELAAREDAPMPEEIARVPFDSKEKERLARQAAGFFSSGDAQKLLQVPYMGYVDPAIGGRDGIETSVTGESCRFAPIIAGDGTILPNQFEVSLSASYVTEKEFEESQRVESAKRVLCENDETGFGTAPIVEGEVRAVFVVHIGDEIVTDTINTQYTAAFQGAPEPFIDVVEDRIEMESLVEEALQYDQRETNKEEPRMVHEVQIATTMFKGAVQKKMQLEHGVAKPISTAELSLDLEGFAPSRDVEEEASETFAIDFERERKSDHRELRIGSKPPVRIKNPRDARAFKGDVADFAMEIGSSPENRKRVKNAILLFSTQHTENRLCGPYNMYVLDQMSSIDRDRQLTAEQVNSAVSFEPVRGSKGEIVKDRLKITLQAEYATMVQIYRDPTGVDDRRFRHAREVMDIGPVLEGEIGASFIVSIPEEGDISIEDLNTKYSIRLP